MAEFFAELKRRQMFRVAAAYAVLAWLLLQVVNNVAPVLDLPVWVARAFLLALVIGFPIALLFVWMRDLAPADAAGPKPATTTPDYVLAGALTIVIGLVSYQQLVLSPHPGTAQQQASGATGTLSIAVLPFANVSGDESQKFFSDGMTDEIASALAKIPGLTVLARSSSFAPEIQSLTARERGRVLNARYLIEGSVRKAGDRVRITAQLVQADNGVGVWTDSYDRELKDIFATQSDIARAIAGALRVPLGLTAGETLVSNRTDDLDSYEQYLRAKALVRARGIRALTDATRLLEEVVDRDPGYAPAWALLALGYGLTPVYHPAWRSGAVREARAVIDVSLPRAETAARRAMQLDPGHADGFLALARVQEGRGKFVAAEDLYKQALVIDPNNPDALDQYGQLLAGVGRLNDALAIRQELQDVEPFVPVFNLVTAQVLWLNGDNEAAIAMLKDLPQDNVNRARLLAKLYAASGRYNEAAEILLESPPGTYPPGIVEEASRLLRLAPAPAVAALPRFGVLEFVYLHVGAASRTLEFYDGNLDAGYSSAIYTASFWHRTYTTVRRTEAFEAFARKAGLVEYWRERGWPDLCRPAGADDFVCD